MTQKGAIKWAKEIKAFQEGKQIQRQTRGVWFDEKSPRFEEDVEYRIKPEPTKRLPTIEEVEKWFLDNRVFRFLGTEILFKIQSIDLNHSHRQIRITNWYSISDFCIQCEPIDGSELYITENE